MAVFLEQCLPIFLAESVNKALRLLSHSRQMTQDPSSLCLGVSRWKVRMGMDSARILWDSEPR